MEADEIVRRLEALRERIRSQLAESPPPAIAEDLDPPPELVMRAAEDPPDIGLDPAARAHLEEANRLAAIGEPITLTSDVPLVGPLVTAVRRLFAPLVRPFIDPYVARQERFNAEVVRHLNLLGESIETRLGQLRDSFHGRTRDPLLLEARLEAALRDYDTVLRQRHTLLFDGLEEELWALRDMLRDQAASLAGAIHGVDARLVQYAQAIDARFDEKDRAIEAAARRPSSSLSESELLATRKRLEQAIAAFEEAAAQPRDADAAGAESGAGASAPPGGDRSAPHDARLWTELRGWLVDQDYRAFQDRFRGDPDTLRAQLAAHVERFRDAPGPVADLGCGGGEFLELLGDAGIPGIGVEINEAEVEDCRQRGLEVESADLFDWLDRRPESSLGGIFAAQVIEHLPPSSWARLMRLAATRLAPGGRLVLETINPQSPYAMMRAYLLDPTHVRPVHPDLLGFLAARAGFNPVDISYQAPVDESERLPRVSASGELAAEVNRTVDRLNAALYAPQEYALVADRPTGTAESA